MQETLDLESALEKAHFRNVSLTSQNYSSELDCFLELTYRIFLPRILSKVEYCNWSEFFQLLQIVGSAEIEFDPFTNIKDNVLPIFDEIRELGPNSRICRLFREEIAMLSFQKFFRAIILKHYLHQKRSFLKH